MTTEIITFYAVCMSLIGVLGVAMSVIAILEATKYDRRRKAFDKRQAKARKARLASFARRFA